MEDSIGSLRMVAGRCLCLVVATLLLNGCAAALVGGAFYKGSKTKGQRQEFMTQLQKTNMEREYKGLKPLDWCSEAYRFDKGYADNDADCSKRIKAYEKGDKTALDMGSSASLEGSSDGQTASVKK